MSALTPKDGLIERMRTLQPEDPLLVGIRWLIGEMRQDDIDGLCIPVIGDEQAHRARGRISAYEDLQRALQQAFDESRKEPERPDRP